MMAPTWTLVGLLAATLASLVAVIISQGSKFDALVARIDNLGATLTARIDNLDATLTARIDEQGASLGAKIDAQSARIDALAIALAEHTRHVI